MKKNFFIIRHGESIYQIAPTAWENFSDKDMPLSPKGHQQAKECGFFLAEELSNGATVIFSSTYRRAKETAQDIAQFVDAKQVIYVDLLQEQNFGIFTGISTSQCYELYPDEALKFDMKADRYGRHNVKMPKGESRLDVEKRIKKFLKKYQSVLNDDSVHNIVIIAHGITNKSLLKVLMDREEDSFQEEGNLTNCSVRRIDKHDGKFIDKGCVFTPHSKSDNNVLYPRNKKGREL